MKTHHWLLIAAAVIVVYFVPLVGPPSGSGLPKMTLFQKLKSDVA